MDDCLSIYQSADDENKKKCDCEAGTETVKRDTKNRNCACTDSSHSCLPLVGFFGDAVASLSLSEEEPLQHTTYL